jgi:hypothetical protein
MPANVSVLHVVGFVIVFFVLLSLRRRREAIAHAMRRIFLAELTYLVVTVLMVKAGRTPLESLLAGVLCGLVVNGRIPGRSRHVPSSVRRKKIAEYELRTGKKFNASKHELDHEVPFSRGGSHTEDNLRVVAKRKNRSKGAKAPWWDLLGR